MAQTKEIRKKIGSVQNTKKITSAMELVASSKMKKTQDAMKRGKPYSVKIVELIDNLSKASSEYKHPFFKTPEGPLLYFGLTMITPFADFTLTAKVSTSSRRLSCSRSPL